MSIDHKKVKEVAELARLTIDDADIPLYVRNLSSILELVKQMNEVDTQDIEPMAHPLQLAQRQRDDVITEQDQRSLFQEVAPETEAGLYLVPKVIGNEAE